MSDEKDLKAGGEGGEGHKANADYLLGKDSVLADQLVSVKDPIKRKEILEAYQEQSDQASNIGTKVHEDLEKQLKETPIERTEGEMGGIDLPRPVRTMGSACSVANFIPFGDQVLIEARGETTEMHVMTEDEGAKVALTFYVGGFGKHHEDCPIGIDDKVCLSSTDEFAIRHIELDGNEDSIVSHVARLSEGNNLSTMAKHVARDKARSKIALNHVSGVDANTIIQFDKRVTDTDGKVIFGQKKVTVVEYYTTHINNVVGIYVEATKEDK